MIKKKFRIRRETRGFIEIYYSQVKTWLGWRYFTCSQTGVIWYFASEYNSEQPAMDNIELYRKSKGLLKEEIIITRKYV